MFDRVGYKLKVVAEILFWLGTALCIFFGIFGIRPTNGWSLLYAACAFIGVFISALCLYGYGQIIENTDKIAKEKTEINQKINNDDNKD